MINRMERVNFTTVRVNARVSALATAKVFGEVANSFRAMCQKVGANMELMHDAVEYGQKVFGKDIPLNTLEKYAGAINLITDLSEALGITSLVSWEHMGLPLVKEVSARIGNIRFITDQEIQWVADYLIAKEVEHIDAVGHLSAMGIE
jgi:hypothetical protein